MYSFYRTFWLPLGYHTNNSNAMLYTQLKKITDADEKKRTVEHLIDLRSQLDKEIPEKTADNTLLLATWNIRQFTDNRRAESYIYIAEILSRFDLIAIQEVKEQRKGLEKVMSILGKNWNYICTDVTEGDKGNGECIAFLYDTNKVSFKNMAGEIVLPSDSLIDDMQFARTPFCVSFQAGWFKFNIATVHIFYGDVSKKEDLERRRKEILTLGKFLSARAQKEEFNYVVLGDFNIPKAGDQYMTALEESGFTIPSRIKKHPTDLGETKHYDQIAFNLHMNDTMQIFDETQPKKSGAFNFTKSVYKESDYEEYIEVMPDVKESVPNPDKPGKNMTVKRKRTGEEAKKYFKTYYRINQMSDHLPLWVELKVDFSSQYIENLRQEILEKEKK